LDVDTIKNFVFWVELKDEPSAKTEAAAKDAADKAAADKAAVDKAAADKAAADKAAVDKAAADKAAADKAAADAAAADAGKLSVSNLKVTGHALKTDGTVSLDPALDLGFTWDSTYNGDTISQFTNKDRTGETLSYTWTIKDAAGKGLWELTQSYGKTGEGVTKDDAKCFVQLYDAFGKGLSSRKDWTCNYMSLPGGIKLAADTKYTVEVTAFDGKDSVKTSVDFTTEKAATEKAATEKAATEKAATEKAAAEKAAAEKAAAEKAAAEKAATEKAAAEKAAAEKAAAEKAAAEKAAAEKAAAEKAAAEKAAAEKAAAEKAAAEKAAAEKAAAGINFNQNYTPTITGLNILNNLDLAQIALNPLSAPDLSQGVTCKGDVCSLVINTHFEAYKYANISQFKIKIDGTEQLITPDPNKWYYDEYNYNLDSAIDLAKNHTFEVQILSDTEYGPQGEKTKKNQASKWAEYKYVPLPAPDLSKGVTCERSVCSLVINTYFEAYKYANISQFKIKIDGIEKTITPDPNKWYYDEYNYNLDSAIDLTKNHTFEVQILSDTEYDQQNNPVAKNQESEWAKYDYITISPLSTSLFDSLLDDLFNLFK